MSYNVSQRVMRNGVLVCEANGTGNGSLSDDGLIPDTDYVYHLVNVDRWGHQSLKVESITRTMAAPESDRSRDRVTDAASVEEGKRSGL